MDCGGYVKVSVANLKLGYSSKESPLVTLALFAYNHEKFIRAAVEAALSQEYSPLEIIISDDCSSDLTFTIIDQIANRYAGQHKLIVNRNEKNLGIGGHIKKMADMSSGEIIVMAAGDDISMPDRVKTLVECFCSDGKPFAVFSDVSHIDESGNVIQERVAKWDNKKKINSVELARNGGGIAVGASYAYRRECFFWPWLYPEFIVSEDRLLPFRAALMGEVNYLSKVLVAYRQSETQITRVVSPELLWAKLKEMHIAELVKTLNYAFDKKIIQPGDYSLMRRIFRELRSYSKLRMYFESKNSLPGRLATIILDNWFNRDTILVRMVAKAGFLKGTS